MTWTSVLVAHAWLAWLGVVVVPAEAFWDVDLYRWWMHLALVEGQWPVLDTPWVYPAGALVPMLLPALATTTSTAGYAIGWSLLVTALGCAAVAVVLARYPGRSGHRAVRWWALLLVLLGPVAVGRLDGVLVPLMTAGLVLALRRPAVASALLAAGAWVKVAPGALLLPLLAAARRPVRHVVLPAVAVTAAVVLAVTAAAALTEGSAQQQPQAGSAPGAHLLSFLSVQDQRDLQVESVAATPWMLAAALGAPDVAVALDEELITYEVSGPGTALAAAVLDVLLPLAVLTVAGTVLLARRRGRADQVLLPAALLLLLVLVVTNKVGSPQFLTWLAAPVMAMIAAGTPSVRLRLLAVGTLLAAAATQVVFPWGYLALLEGDAAVAVVLAVRNALLVALTALAALGVRAAVRGPAAQPS